MNSKELSKQPLFQIDSKQIYFYISSIPRINGELAVTRAFGDKKHRPSGLIAVPEIKQYQIKECDKYLVLASDGFWDVITEFNKRL